MLKIIVCLLLAVPLLSQAQSEYPYSVLPGQSKEIKSTTDTLWVMKHSQMQKAIFAAKENKLLKEEIALLRDKGKLTNQATSVRDSLLSLSQQDANHYKQQWLECDKDFQTVTKNTNNSD